MTNRDGRARFAPWTAGLVLFMVLALSLVPAPVRAGDGDLDLLMEAFDGPESERAGEAALTPPPPAPEKKRVDLYGSVILNTMIRTRPKSRDVLAQLAPELELMARADLGAGWRAFGRGLASHDLAPGLGSHFTDAESSDLEAQWEVNELWVEKSLFPWMDIRLGRQIVAWGTSEVFRLVDLINPTDQRNMGMTDIEDLRLGQEMSRVDFYSGPWNLTLVMIHGDRMPKTPAWGSDFYPSDTPLPPTDPIDDDWDDPRFAGALTGRFTGWDAGLYLARTHDDKAVARMDCSSGPRLEYPKITMAGATLTKSLGNFLIKSEVAYMDGLRFSRAGDREYRGLDTLLGMEYSGFTDTTLTLEVVNRHIFDLEEIPGLERMEKNHLESAFRLDRDFMNETLNLTMVAGFMGATGDLGSFQRLELEYEWSDTLFFKIGAVVYHNGDSRLFDRIHDNDRIFFTITKDFS